jgi:maltooligosyltrehalose trehalohydrolase
MERQWGPELRGDGARFRLWAPDRETVKLEIRGYEPFAMTLESDGWFIAEARADAGARYRFRLSEELAVADPASRQQNGGVHGWSVLTDPEGFDWQTRDWTGRPWEETVIEEVHPGVLGGFAGVAERLPSLADLGVTAVELMPVGAFSGTRNWGYDGVLPYAVAESYGSPDELKALVDRAHSLGLMVFLDVVYNHFGPDGNYLGAYASDFFDEHAHTPWGGAVAVAREPVRRFFIDNALMWLDEYRIDGLRFDAVHAIADDEFLDAMAHEIRTKLPDRHIHLMLENEGNDPDRLRPGLYHAQWNDDFHNVLHVLLTDESEGYYRGFAQDATSKLARCLAEGFIYQGETPPGSDHPRGKPSRDLSATRFVSFLQNHDQIGNRALGERLVQLVDPDRLRAATALLLLSPQIPLIFMGDSEGSRSPFLFFTDFHDELADAVREGRRGEFAGFAAFSDEKARAGIPDPNDPETFRRSRPEPGPDVEEWRRFYRDLLALRHKAVVPRLKDATGIGAEVLGEGAVAARWQMGDGAQLAIAFNIGRRKVDFPAAREVPLFQLGQAGGPGSLRAEIVP